MDQTHFVAKIVKKTCSQERGSLKANNEDQEESVNQKLRIKRVNKRLFNNVKIANYINPFHHVYTFLKSFSINQNSLKTQDYEESIFRSWFYHRVVTKVQKYQNAVVIFAVPQSDVFQQPQEKHYLSKLKLLQRTRDPNLITILEQILSFVSEQKNNKRKEMTDCDSYSVTKILNSFKDDMFISKLGLNRMAISNSLLEYLGIDIDEFCIETVKYRTILFDFLSASSYPAMVTHCFKYLRNVFALSQGKITKQQLIQSRIYRFSDFVYGKNNMKSYCDIQVNFPLSEILLLKITKVHYQVNELKWRRYGPFESEYSRQKQKLNQKQFQLLYQLQNEPEQGKTKNKVARYIYDSTFKG